MKDDFFKFNLEDEPEDEFEENEEQEEEDEEDEEDLGTCQCRGCGCDAPATTRDDGGVPVCWKCKTFMVTDGGDVICGRMGLGTRCHVCREKISWGCILTGGYRGNRRYGTCDCGEDAWTIEEAGGEWDEYNYSPPKPEEEAD